MHAVRTHPLTGEPIHPIGTNPRTGALRWPIMGGSENPPEPPAPADPPADPPAATPPAPAPPADPPTPAPKADDLPEDRDELVKMIGKLREENAAARTGAKQKAADDAKAELAQTIGKALGIVKDDEPVDPAELAKQIETSKAGERTAQVHLAVFKKAGEHKGDPSALLDSNSFLAKLADLDPTASDFDAKVGEAIKDAVASNPKLAVGPAPGSSASDHPGGGDAPRRTEAKSIADGVKSTLGF